MKIEFLTKIGEPFFIQKEGGIKPVFELGKISVLEVIGKSLQDSVYTLFYQGKKIKVYSKAELFIGEKIKLSLKNDSEPQEFRISGRNYKKKILQKI